MALMYGKDKIIQNWASYSPDTNKNALFKGLSRFIFKTIDGLFLNFIYAKIHNDNGG